MVQLGATVKPAMNIFVPFTKVQPWTMAAMLWYLHHTTFVDVSNDEWDYLRYFENRWREKKTFITVEHDVVPGGGLIDSMWSCGSDWCVSHYFGPPAPRNYTDGYVPPFAVVKFSAEFIEAIPDVWAERRRVAKTWKVGHAHAHKETGGCCGETGWWALDTWLGEYVQDKGVSWCDHWPCVTHGSKRDAFYAQIQVTDANDRVLKTHPLKTNPIELTLPTL